MIDGVSLSHSAYAGLVGKKARCDDEHREIFVFYICSTEVDRYVQKRYAQAG